MQIPNPNQHSGPLAGHVKRGRVFQTPLAASGAVKLEDWVRDDLPDLLWPALVLAEQGDLAADSFARWQSDVITALDGTVDKRLLAECLDGRLTGLERLGKSESSAVEVVRSTAARRGLLSSQVQQALSSYPSRPAEWLSSYPMKPPRQEEADRLAAAVRGVVADYHREALVKCLSLWAAVQAGAFRTNSETVELLKHYPHDLATRDEADVAVCALWSAIRATRLSEDGHCLDEATRWARAFWGANSMTTGCVRERDLPAEDPDSSSMEESEPAATNQNDSSGDLPPADFQRRAMDLMSSYVEAVESSPSRLYDQEREEVHLGLVARAGREVITALGIELLWCSEHGSHIGRVLTENRILLEWMAQQDQALIYRKYQDYGAGKAKLHSRLAAELPQNWLVDGLDESIRAVERASHNDDVLDLRAVDVSATFAGKSLRVMADECGLSDLYRHAYQLSSGVVHSEWWSIEMHCMERCLNILHRGHLIPSLSLPMGNNADLARSWLIALYGLIQVSLDILATPEAQVDAAFAWLKAAPMPEDAWARRSGDTEAETAG